ncbi:hypothetical protein MED297_08166 [Reinekea sp. MED297]|uniref:VIT family protein n=2 Tax=Reinekea TaxID=230494 RepID=A4BCW6_9GAMM|nr:hypothetical protein MED297_08166 [Reinekea sp. MED297] [Reinekea blandensis MED297]
MPEMMTWRALQQALEISQSDGLIRRYFVVNGFDGALTMLGILGGFYMSHTEDLHIVISACLGAAIALFMSGLSAAYISEAAESQKALAETEQAMGKSLKDSAHGRAARWVPWLVGAVNGLSPLVIALIILIPVFVHQPGMAYSPLVLSISVGLGLMFLLGFFLSRVSQTHWLLGGVKALSVGLLTLAIILLLE